MIQVLVDSTPTDALLKEEETLVKELEEVLLQEEIFWFQKSREKLMALGDINTKYFHTSTIIRRRRNRIEMLKDDAGAWITNAQDLENVVVEYYNRLYSMVDVEQDMEKLTQVGFEKLTDQELNGLNKVFLGTEVESSIRSMGKYKAPGPDGY